MIFFFPLSAPQVGRAFSKLRSDHATAARDALIERFQLDRTLVPQLYEPKDISSTDRSRSNKRQKKDVMLAPEVEIWKAHVAAHVLEQFPQVPTWDVAAQLGGELIPTRKGKMLNQSASDKAWTATVVCILDCCEMRRNAHGNRAH